MSTGIVAQLNIYMIGRYIMKLYQVIALVLVLAIIFPAGLLSAMASSLNASSKAVRSSQASDLPQDVYEAEHAQLQDATVETSLDDYLGEGYVDGLKTGSSVTFTVNVPEAGNYGVRMRYSNGSGQRRTINVYVNGEFVRRATFLQTINWNTWDMHLENLALNAGENTITYKVDSDNTGADIKLDRISLSRIYEAEDAVLLGGMGTNNDHIDYSGTGFAAGFNATGQGVQFTVNVPEAGEYVLSVRYAAGQTDADGRSVSMIINGNKTQEFFGTLRNWDIWWDTVFIVNLNQGNNTIIFRRDSGDNGEINIDYITVKPRVWHFVGEVQEYSGNNTDELTFVCDNATVKITSVDTNTVKVWCEPSGRFSRMYDSFAVVNEKINPQKLSVSDKGDYYQFVNGDIVVRVNKNPFKITYLNKAGNILLENDEQSMGWTEDGEITVNNKLQADEQFWGLGEKLNKFNRRGQKLVMWSHDAYGAVNSSSVPSWENGRWYFSNPYFISSKGYSIYFDNTSRTVFDMGYGAPTKYSFGSYYPNPGGELLYYFIYGPSIKQITKRFTDMVGKTFFAPMWALGNMQSHYGYTQSDIERVAQTYRDKNIPIDVIMADIEWYEYLCYPGEWSKSNFPNPQRMLDLLESLNIRMAVINDPNVTDRNNNQYYRDGDTKGIFVKDRTGNTKKINWPWGAASGLVDFFNPAGVEWWKQSLQMLFNQGVTTFWLDMNEPAKYNNDWYFWNKEGKSWGSLSEVKNAYAIMHNKAMYDIVSELGKRPFLMTRSGFTGSQRYVTPWTGDIQGSWQSMNEQINMGTSLSLTGYNYWAFDIGGFFSTVSNDQYKRWVELATFMPVHRFHYCNGVEAKEPWTHNSEELSRQYINLRYQLIPYFYSVIADNIIGIGIEEGYGEGGTGIPMVRPMVMEYPDDKNTWNMDSQFMSGPFFLVAPVYEATTTKRVYLPEGRWYDYKDGKTIYSGSGYMDYNAPVDTLPVFVKEGAIIPMQPVMQYIGEKPVDQLTLDIYPLTKSGKSHFVLYEDDGETYNYLEGEYATTRYECNVNLSDTSQIITFNIGKRTGKYTDIDERGYLLKFHKGAMKNLTVQHNGTAMKKYTSQKAFEAVTSGYYIDEQSQICYVKLPDNGLANTVVLSGDRSDIEIYQAESGQLSGNAKAATQDKGYTGTGYVVVTAESDAVNFTLSGVEQDGLYGLRVRYANGNSAEQAITLSVNNGAEVKNVKLPPTGSFSTWDSAMVIVSLNSGENSVKISGKGGKVNIDGLIRLTTPVVMPVLNELTVEAEDSELLGNVIKDYVVANSSGTGYVRGFASQGDGVKFTVNALANGTYTVRIRYGNKTDGEQKLSVYANNKDGVKEVTFPWTAEWDKWNEVYVSLPLKSGENTITVEYGSQSTGGINIDSLIVPAEPYTLTSSPIANGGFEAGNTTGWTVAKPTDHGVDGYDAYSGSYKFYFWNGGSDFENRLSQTVNGLENGTYMLTFWVKVYNAEPIASRLELTEYDGSKQTILQLPHTGDWRKYSQMVEVKDGKLTLSFYFNGRASSSLQLDDVYLYKVNAAAVSNKKSTLESAVQNASKLDKSSYTYESWSNFEIALAMANRVLEDQSATAGQILGAVVALENAKAALESVGGYQKGDVNKDGRITVVDIVALRGIIMSGETPNSEQLSLGDIDNDNRLTVTDIVGLRRIIMSQE